MAPGNPLAEHYVDDRMESMRWLCVKAAHEGLIPWETARAIFQLALDKKPDGPPEDTDTPQD